MRKKLKISVFLFFLSVTLSLSSCVGIGGLSILSCVTELPEINDKTKELTPSLENGIRKYFKTQELSSNYYLSIEKDEENSSADTSSNSALNAISTHGKRRLFYEEEHKRRNYWQKDAAYYDGKILKEYNGLKDKETSSKFDWKKEELDLIPGILSEKIKEIFERVSIEEAYSNKDFDAKIGIDNSFHIAFNEKQINKSNILKFEDCDIDVLKKKFDILRGFDGDDNIHINWFAVDGVCNNDATKVEDISINFAIGKKGSNSTVYFDVRYGWDSFVGAEPSLYNQYKLKKVP